MWPLVIRHFPDGIAAQNLMVLFWTKTEQKTCCCWFSVQFLCNPVYSLGILPFGREGSDWGIPPSSGVGTQLSLGLQYSLGLQMTWVPWVFLYASGSWKALLCLHTLISSQTQHTHNTARLLVSACIFSLFRCFSLDVFSYRSSSRRPIAFSHLCSALLLLYFFNLFYHFFLAIFLQLWHCHITSALMWIIIIEIKKEKKKRKRQTQQEEPTESLWSSSLKSKYA